MLKIFRYLKDNILSVILIILLLIVQANCDLTIPKYTSNIINVGVQQGGIEEVNPKVIRESKLDEILLFVNDKDKKDILSNYKLVTEKNNKYNYDILDEESVYVILDEEKSNSDLEKAILVDYMLTSKEKEAVNIQNNIKKDMPSSMESMDLIDIIKLLPTSELNEMRKSINKQFNSMPDSIISQSAVSAIKQEYIEIGLDTDAIQTNYIIITGLKMLGLSLVSVASTIITVLLGARVGSGLSKRVRRKEFKKVLGFGTAEYKNIGISSLITRSTNDIQQVQMMIIMTLRLFIYAPIIAIGAVRKVFETAPSMTYIIWLGIVCVLTLIFTLFALSMPKFKKVQKLIDKLNQVTREIITGIPVIRAFSNQKYEEERFSKANTNLKKTNLFVNRVMNFMMPGMMFIMNGIVVLIIWIGAHKIDEGLLQVGDMLAFIQYSMQIIMAFLMISMFSIMDSSIIVSFITGAWFTALMASNIFVIQEKNNLNRLYGSVSVELKDIVLGRYIFAFSNYAISLVTVIVVSLIVSLFRDMFIDVSNILLGFSLSLLIFSIITGIQMPLFFKLGYTKAKIWAVVPILVVMLLVIIPSFITVLSTFIQSVMSNRSMIIAVGIVASCVIQLISYKIAVIAYRKRK